MQCCFRSIQAVFLCTNRDLESERHVSCSRVLSFEQIDNVIFFICRSVHGRAPTYMFDLIKTHWSRPGVPGRNVTPSLPSGRSATPSSPTCTHVCTSSAGTPTWELVLEGPVDFGPAGVDQVQFPPLSPSRPFTGTSARATSPRSSTLVGVVIAADISASATEVKVFVQEEELRRAEDGVRNANHRQDSPRSHFSEWTTVQKPLSNPRPQASWALS